jgi:hypothetical protein
MRARRRRPVVIRGGSHDERKVQELDPPRCSECGKPIAAGVLRANVRAERYHVECYDETRHRTPLSPLRIPRARRPVVRSSGLTGGSRDGEPMKHMPLLTLGQPVRHPDRSDIGVVIGMIFPVPERALVRWVDGVSFEPVGLLIEVRQFEA